MGAQWNSGLLHGASDGGSTRYPPGRARCSPKKIEHGLAACGAFSFSGEILRRGSLPNAGVHCLGNEPHKGGGNFPERGMSRTSRKRVFGSTQNANMDSVSEIIPARCRTDFSQAVDPETIRCSRDTCRLHDVAPPAPPSPLPNPGGPRAGASGSPGRDRGQAGRRPGEPGP